VDAIGLLGVPANSSGKVDGVARAPVALREAGLVETLSELVDLLDYGDVSLPEPSPVRDPITHLIDPSGLVAMITVVRDAVATILDDGRLPLVIGGDCPILLGCLLAARGDASVGLLFADGHEDAYMPEQSTTGEAADTELALALGLADVSWAPTLAAGMPVIAPADVKILGARDAATLRAEGVDSLEDRVEIVDDTRLAEDPSACTRVATSSLPPRWWFHLDLDVLSTDALPAVDYPQRGGLGWGELTAVATTAVEGGPIGWDIAIYNPDLDAERVHAAAIIRFIASVIDSSQPDESRRHRLRPRPPG
jgi:arginase